MSPETSDPLWALPFWYSSKGRCPTLARRRRSEKGWRTILKASIQRVPHYRKKQYLQSKNNTVKTNSDTRFTRSSPLVYRRTERSIVRCYTNHSPKNFTGPTLFHRAVASQTVASITHKFHWSSTCLRYVTCCCCQLNSTSPKHGGHCIKLSGMTSRPPASSWVPRGPWMWRNNWNPSKLSVNVKLERFV